MGYVLGVDGGNTKTDYYLFDTEANFIDMYRGGTCSHEGLKDSFLGTHRIMKEVITNFLKKNNLTVNDIDAAAFGLAGDDIPSQQKKLEEIIASIGFKKFKVVNDSLLGIKAKTTNGVGACSINGTGTSSGGIDVFQNILQVGGIGEIVGDEAGGRFIARKVVRAAFDDLMRFGKHTSLTKIVLDLLNVENKFDLMEAISEVYIKNKVDYNVLTIACFTEANKGDEVAITILKNMADNLARSCGSVVVNLDLGNPPEIVLAGSVYVKGSCPILIEEFKRKIKEYTKKDCVISVLTVPPATGAIIWALELYHNAFPNSSIRSKIIQEVEKQLRKIQ